MLVTALETFSSDMAYSQLPALDADKNNKKIIMLRTIIIDQDLTLL